MEQAWILHPFPVGRTSEAQPGHTDEMTQFIYALIGNRNIQHTVRYTELSPGRFKDFWR